MHHLIRDLIPTGPTDEHTHRGARRLSARFPLDARVEVRSRSGAASGLVLNASEGGLRIAADRGYEAGTRLDVDVLLASGRAIRERVQVVWASARPDGWVLGLAFAH